MSDDDGQPPYWWQGEDGAQIIRGVWAAVEEAFLLGADTEVKLTKPGQPTLVIAFDHEVTDDDDSWKD